ncbi:ABC transporter substrate-binding protein [Clostridium ganghwense]|uniref:ABC transporter substrate-binding protein n=1 Tax=Clostridium ganghwense TaxID=312089 RepID=A0ABT4CNC6_9CLOT|nr:ABC transporter substrate-binding protein [Clostridium ganghwense]MCY6369716.1 ABC transporter substrate-binding protein [Clostridium ganghwense]
MKKFIVVFLILCMTLGSGCIQKKVVNTEVRDYIVYNIGKLPEDLIMLDRHNIRQEDLLLCLFEGLVSMDKKGKIVPALAFKWEISEDKLSYIFTIRNDAKWSDGSDIVAEDFVNLFSNLLKNENNIYKQQLYCIFGARDYAENKVDFSKVAVMAKDNKTLEIRLNYACSYFLNILSQPIYVLRKDFKYLKEWKNNFSLILYSGPFKLDSILEKEELSLVKNQMYWDEKSVASNKIHMKNEEAIAFALADYKWDEIDIITNPPMNQINEFIKAKELFRSPSINGMSLNFNFNKEGIIKDINFRKCISYCINRKNIINNIVLGEGANSFIPSSIKSSGENKILFANYSNLDKAKEFLDKSEYKGEKIKLVYLNSNENNKEIVDEIIKNLKKIKIKISVEGYNEEMLKEIIHNEEYDILLTHYIGEYNSPIAFLEKWDSNSKFNIYGYNNLEYDVLILKAKLTGDSSEAIKYLSFAEELLYNDIPCIPLYFSKNIVGAKRYINGLEVNKRGNVILKKVYIHKQNE